MDISENTVQKIMEHLAKISDEQHEASVTRALILQRVEDLECHVSELNNLLLGSDGRGGLVTEIAVMKQFFDNAYKEFSNGNGKDKNGKDRYVTWAWTVDKILQPIIIAIVIYLLFTIVPKLGGLP